MCSGTCRYAADERGAVGVLVVGQALVPELLHRIGEEHGACRGGGLDAGARQAIIANNVRAPVTAANRRITIADLLFRLGGLYALGLFDAVRAESPAPGGSCEHRRMRTLD